MNRNWHITISSYSQGVLFRLELCGTIHTRSWSQVLYGLFLKTLSLISMKRYLMVNAEVCKFRGPALREVSGVGLITIRCGEVGG